VVEPFFGVVGKDQSFLVLLGEHLLSIPCFLDFGSPLSEDGRLSF
jgi:hypothetical protein